MLYNYCSQIDECHQVPPSEIKRVKKSIYTKDFVFWFAHAKLHMCTKLPRYGYIYMNLYFVCIIACKMFTDRCTLCLQMGSKINVKSDWYQDYTLIRRASIKTLTVTVEWQQQRQHHQCTEALTIVHFLFAISL